MKHRRKCSDKFAHDVAYLFAQTIANASLSTVTVACPVRRSS